MKISEYINNNNIQNGLKDMRRMSPAPFSFIPNQQFCVYLTKNVFIYFTLLPIFFMKIMKHLTRIRKNSEFTML